MANPEYTSAGEANIVDLIDGSGGTVLSAANAKVAWGTGTTAPVKGDTTLETEASESRVAAAISQPSADINQWVATITADGTKSISEAGLLSAAAAGILIIRGTFTAIPVVLNDQIEFTITLEQT